MFSASYKISSVLLCGFLVGLLPSLSAMDPEKDGTTPTACAAKPVKSMAPDSGEPFNPNHMMLDDLFALNRFLAKAKGGTDPLDTPPQHTGLTLCGTLLHDLITPTKADDVACDFSTEQKADLFERLANYCKHNARNLGINITCPSNPTVVSRPDANGIPKWVTIPGVQDLRSYQGLFDLPVTHVDIFGMASLNDISALEACKDTLQSLIIYVSAIESADGFGTLTNLSEVSLASPLLSDLSAFRNCHALRTASFTSCIRVTDVSPLKDLPVLTSLNLFDCRVTDARMFLAFPALNYLNLNGNEILDRSCVRALTAKISTLKLPDAPEEALPYTGADVIRGLAEAAQRRDKMSDEQRARTEYNPQNGHNA